MLEQEVNNMHSLQNVYISSTANYVCCEQPCLLYVHLSGHVLYVCFTVFYHVTHTLYI